MMSELNQPRYPVYVISKGRPNCITAQFFARDGVNCKIVVEPQEEEIYRAQHGDSVVTLPFSNLDQGSMPARNWCWEDAKAAGYRRHWIFDDNIHRMRRLYRGKRLPCNSRIALATVEDWTDRYENVAIAGFNYTMFVMNSNQYPFSLNHHVYSALLIDNQIPQRWRMRYNEDTDLCLQVLTTGKLCTVLFNAFMVDKVRTLHMKGGNMDELYQGNGRLVMARALEEMWPNHVEVVWRFGRPQHRIKGDWKNFRHPLIRRKDIDWEELERRGTDERGMKLKQVSEKIRSKDLRRIADAYAATYGADDS